jgi:hypothetical protein
LLEPLAKKPKKSRRTAEKSRTNKTGDLSKEVQFI